MLRFGNHYVAIRKLRVATLEFLLATTAAVSAALLLIGPQNQTTAAVRGAIAVGASLAITAALYLADLYDLRIARYDAPSGGRLVRSLAAVCLLLGAVQAAHLVGAPPGTALAAAGGALLGIALFRWQYERLARWLGAREPVAILGEGPLMEKLRHDLSLDGDAGVELTGAIPERAAGLAETLREGGVSLLVVSTHDRRGRLPVEELLSARLLGITVVDAVQFYERWLRRIPIGSLRPSDLIFGEPLQPGPIDRVLCRLLHVAVATLLLVLISPVIALVALAISLDSRGPVLYRQTRVGLGGRTFTLLKFRTMRADAEADGAQWARHGDDRITRVGRLLRKTRLDEVPQLWNVLKGEMALVGPRPERPEFVGQLKAAIPYYGLREAARPGLTGWAQVKYSYASSIEEQREKLEFDLYYVRHRSLLLDLWILASTVKVVLLGRGAK